MVDAVPSQRLYGNQLPGALRRDALTKARRRFTGTHVPRWAQDLAPNGRHYAPQYRDDDEWLAKTTFVVRRTDDGMELLNPEVRYASHEPSFPWGQWLKKPFAPVTPDTPNAPTAHPTHEPRASTALSPIPKETHMDHMDLAAIAQQHTHEGVKARIYGAKTDADKPSEYRGAIVAVVDGRAIQKLNERGSFVVHENVEGLAEGELVRITYTKGQREIAPYNPGEAFRADAANSTPEAKGPGASDGAAPTDGGGKAKRSMADIDNEKYRDVAERIVASIDRGTSIWQKPWTAPSSRARPHNGETGLNYQGVNRVLLMTEMMANDWSDTRFMTYRQVEKLAAQMKRNGTEEDKLPHVAKGSTGIPIYKMGSFDKKTPVLDGQGQPVLDDEGKPKFKVVPGKKFLQSYMVFHASCIENLPPMPEGEKKELWQVHAQVEDLVQELGVTVRYEPENRAFYSPSMDYIQMPEREQFKTANDFYAVLMHESIHATGHESRLKRPLTGMFGDSAYAYEELVAETGSAFTTAELGLVSDEVMNRHASYLEGWKKRIMEDPRALFKAFSEAEQAADWVMQRHPKQLEAKRVIEAERDGHGLVPDSRLPGVNPLPTSAPSGPAAPDHDNDYTM